MSAYKQAGISLNRAMAIAARATREALKPEFKVAAEKRGLTEAKVARVEKGAALEAKFLGA
jgi:F-type H+-transporting ATPase subunit epsilon